MHSIELHTHRLGAGLHCAGCGRVSKLVEKQRAEGVLEDGRVIEPDPVDRNGLHSTAVQYSLLVHQEDYTIQFSTE